MAQVAATEEATKASGIKVHKLSELSADEVRGLRARPRIDFTSIFETVGSPLQILIDIIVCIELGCVSSVAHLNL